MQRYSLSLPFFSRDRETTCWRKIDKRCLLRLGSLVANSTFPGRKSLTFLQHRWLYDFGEISTIRLTRHRAYLERDTHSHVKVALVDASRLGRRDADEARRYAAPRRVASRSAHHRYARVRFTNAKPHTSCIYKYLHFENGDDSIYARPFPNSVDCHR